MARKARDYAAEQRRRNELARERGHRSRADQRRKIELGKIPALAPKRLRNPVTLKNQKLRVTTPKRKHVKKPTEYGGYKLPSLEDRSTDWSTMFARSESGTYAPDTRPDDTTKAAYRSAYMKAFVAGPARYDLVRHHGGSPDLKYWLVTLNHFMSVSEYESRYGGQ